MSWDPSFMSVNPYYNENLMTDDINPQLEIKKDDWPFEHFIIDNFLKKDIHHMIKSEMINIPVDTGNLYKGQLVPPVDHPLLVGYSGDWHDAYRMFLHPKFELKMNLFMKKDMSLFLQSFFPSIYCTNEVLIDLHHHREFSKDGFVHNDFDPSIFTEDIMTSDGMDLSYQYAYQDACDNQRDGVRYVQKSIAWAYYIGLGEKIDESKPVGGHTALFTDNDRTTPALGVEPIENRLLMFAIGPESFHGSRSNNTTYRDALFGWFHSEMEYVKKRFPFSDPCNNVRSTGWKPSDDGSYGKSVKNRKSK